MDSIQQLPLDFNPVGYCACGCGQRTTVVRGMPHKFIRGHYQRVKPSTLIDRLWRHIVKADDPDACWQWTGQKNRAGYGMLHDGKTTAVAHRLLWITLNGPLPRNLKVCHSCDNPECCNPRHLWVGTQRQNMQDCQDKGRMAYGTRVGSAVLTDDIVREMRRRYAAGENSTQLGAAYGTHPTNVLEIVHRKTWQHVE